MRKTVKDRISGALCYHRTKDGIWTKYIVTVEERKRSKEEQYSYTFSKVYERGIDDR